MRPEEIAEALQKLPMHAYDSLASRSPDQPPRAHGMYAWWQTPGALPGVPGTPHPNADLELLYVGTAPVGPDSKSHLRQRLGNHHHAAIGSSTFRLALTAFLWESQGWFPSWEFARGKPVLSAHELGTLADWQRQHLSVQWTEMVKPWAIENEVIELMRPPLNWEHNQQHPFWLTLDAKRAALRHAARASQT